MRAAPCALAVPCVLAALCVLALVAQLLGCTPAEPSPASPAATTAEADPVRIKGLVPRISIHRRRGEQIEHLRDGASVRAGDLVQISYMAAGNRHGVVVSLDGRGVATLHHPTRPDARAVLVAHGEHALDHAYELDDAESYERFVFVTSGDEPLEPERVLEAARRLAQRGPSARHSDLPLPARWSQHSVVLHKSP